MSAKDLIPKIRLWTGCLLFVFVVTHYLNHALGNISLDAMEAGRHLFLAVWRNPVGTVLLYGALILHVLSVLYALFRRRTLRMPFGEAVQVAFGAVIPIMLATHVIANRVAHEVYGLNDTYAYVVLSLWVWDWQQGVLQAIALLVVWIHGCLGLHYWLRLKPSYPRLQPYLFAAALLLPAAALSGFAAAGKQAAFLINDPLWREQTLALINLPGRDAVEWVYQRADTTRIGTAITVGIVLLLRFGRALWERRKRRVTVTYPDGRSVTVEQGCSVLDVSRQAGIPHASVCGGRGRCSTCRVRVAMGSVGLPPPSDEEVKVLRRVAAPVNVRLACQLRPNQDVTVIPLLPATAQPKDGFRKPQYLQGSEREIAILFADLRSFTKFSESKLPYDVVFVINQYFRLMGTAVETAGGRLDKFIGDGVMALFGVDNGLEQGCRDAINAARAMGRALDELNDNLENELDEPLRMGIGIHAGPAIVGEMGFRAATSVTAIGDSVNTASRLEAMTKEFESQLILSRTVTDAAGVDADDFPEHQIQVRGRAEMMTVYVLDKTADLPEQARENNRRNRRGDVNAGAAPAR